MRDFSILQDFRGAIAKSCVTIAQNRIFGTLTFHLIPFKLTNVERPQHIFVFSSNHLKKTIS